MGTSGALVPGPDGTVWNQMGTLSRREPLSLPFLNTPHLPPASRENPDGLSPRPKHLLRSGRRFPLPRTADKNHALYRLGREVSASKPPMNTHRTANRRAEWSGWQARPPASIPNPFPQGTSPGEHRPRRHPGTTRPEMDWQESCPASTSGTSSRGASSGKPVPDGSRPRVATTGVHAYRHYTRKGWTSPVTGQFTFVPPPLVLRRRLGVVLPLLVHDQPGFAHTPHGVSLDCPV